MANEVDYIYELIQNESNARICAYLIADEFTLREPTATFEAISSEDFFEKNALPILLKYIAEGLSFLGRHRVSNEIISVIIAYDFYFENKQDSESRSSEQASFTIIDILSELKEMFIEHDCKQIIKPQLILHIHAGATKMYHSGNGVATRL